MARSKIKPVLNWKVTKCRGYSIASFGISGGLLQPASLPYSRLPESRLSRREGLVITGRGPVWLYAHLAHLAHAFAWLAVHDPRLGGFVVCANHLPDGPVIGSILPAIEELPR